MPSVRVISERSTVMLQSLASSACVAELSICESRNSTVVLSEHLMPLPPAPTTTKLSMLKDYRVPEAPSFPTVRRPPIRPSPAKFKGVKAPVEPSVLRPRYFDSVEGSAFLDSLGPEGRRKVTKEKRPWNSKLGVITNSVWYSPRGVVIWYVCGCWHVVFICFPARF